MTIKLTIIFILTSTFLLSQKPFDTKKYGQLILDGKVKYDGTNEEKMFRTLDSLFCKSKDNKNFYFKVANIIQRLSDGALGEYFAGIARKYYMDNNKEFIANVSKMTSKDLANWLSQVAFDIAADEQDLKSLPKIKKSLDKLVLNCNCDEAKKQLIKKYNADIYKEVEFNLKD
jgi:hypothetical protein